MVTANSVKCSSVSCKIFPSKLRQASQVARRSKLAFWASISTLLREYDNILCSSLCWNDLRSQAPHKSSPLSENFKITFNFILGHIRFVLMLVLHFVKSRDVTSLLKWVYRWRYQWFIELRKSIIGVRIGGGVRLHFG